MSDYELEMMGKAEKAMATQEKITFKEFRSRFSDDGACKEYMTQLRWPNGFACPQCGSVSYYLLGNRGLYQCKDCKHQTSVTAGTIMHRSHLPLTTWFWAIYLTARDKRGLSAVQLEAELEVTYKTAWFLLHRIRSAMGQRDAAYLLSGIVEFDDSYFGGPGTGGKRGRGTTKAKVLIAMATSNGGRPQYLKMQVASNLKGKTIGNFAESAIRSGSTIISDAFHSYRKPLKEKYLHQYMVFDPASGELRWLHTMIGNAKAFVQGTYHGLGKKHLQCYLDEFCYRFNRRNFPGEAFARLLAAVVAANPLSLAELKG